MNALKIKALIIAMVVFFGGQSLACQRDNTEDFGGEMGDEADPVRIEKILKLWGRIPLPIFWVSPGQIVHEVSRAQKHLRKSTDRAHKPQGPFDQSDPVCL